LIIATHDVDLVPLFANEICILNKGQIVLQRPPQEGFAKTDLILSMNLRLPRITHLFEILSKRNQRLTDKQFPLTIGEARREILELIEANQQALILTHKVIAPSSNHSTINNLSRRVTHNYCCTHVNFSLQHLFKRRNNDSFPFSSSLLNNAHRSFRVHMLEQYFVRFS